MNNYPKIKLGNGNTYDVVAGGLYATDEKLLITILPGEKGVGEIDAEFDLPANVGRIEVLDSDGAVDDVKHGYAYMTDCQRKKNYVIGSEQVEVGVGEGENSIKEYQDVVGTVMVITLAKSDMRKELQETKAEVSGLNEIVDMLVVANLEG